MYRTIDTAIWHDPKFRALPAPGKLLFIYLITNPHAHVSGIYYLPDVTILHESGVKSESLNTLWDTLSRSELVFRDEKLEVVWVKNMLKRQGMHDKLIASAANHLETLHNSKLIQRFTDFYPGVKKRLGRKGINRVSRSRLQEQEQEQEENTPQPPQAGANGGAAKRRRSPQGDSEVLPGFQVFWSEYPECERKVNRTGCERRWRRLGLESVAEQVIAGLRRWKASDSWQRGFVPLPMTWLNQERWKAPAGSANGAAEQAAPVNEPVIHRDL